MSERRIVCGAKKRPIFLCQLLLKVSLVSISAYLGLFQDKAVAAEGAIADTPDFLYSDERIKSKSIKLEGIEFEGIESESLEPESFEPESLEQLGITQVASEQIASEQIASEQAISETSLFNLLGTSSLTPEERVSDSPASEGLEGSVDLAQVTSVSELSDVQPGDWAFTALQRLVEEYGCLEGYPDSSYRGDRALTRYEFAAGLNACLDVVIQLIGTDDFDSVRRLQEEFAAELAAVRSQLDTLETDVAELDANQFSTTTKLSVQLFTHLNGATASGDVLAEGNSIFVPARGPNNQPVVRTLDEDPAITFSYLSWINLTTSFTGQDQLQLQLVAGDGRGSANFYGSAGLFNTFGTPFTVQTGSRIEDSLGFREVFYSFPVGDQLSLTIGPKINWYRHFDNNRFTFLVTGANSFNSSGGTQVNAVDRGSGIVAEWDIANWLDLRVGYLAEANEFLPGLSSSTRNGLFDGTTTLTGQVGVYPAKDLNLRFLYTRTNLEPNTAGFVGGAISEPIYGFADDGFGGPLRIATADTFLFNFDWLVTQGIGLFGRYSYGSTDVYPVSDALPDGRINAQSVQLGLAFPDLLKQGALATISYVQPFEVLDGEDFLISGSGDGATQRELEVSYRYPFSPNFALVPSIYWIQNVNNFGDNPDVYVFNLQTQFSF